MVEKVRKRNSDVLVDFDPKKIRGAIKKAKREINSNISDKDIEFIVNKITNDPKDILDVEEIQDKVQYLIMELGFYNLAVCYITYRYKREIIRKANTTDESILKLIRDENSDVAKENSNKKAVLNSTKRDLIAGEVSKDLTKRILLPQKIVEADEKGIIHFHDKDYFMMNEFNCCLPNFRDMLKNGSAINGVEIDTPKSFRVACTQVTQIMASISSNQYGG